VRVSHTDRCCRSPQIGWLESVSADSVVLATDSAGHAVRISLPRAAVQSFEVGEVSGTHTMKGALIGGLGAGVGGAAAILMMTDCQDDEICHGLRPAIALAVGGASAFVGLVVGGLVGHSVPRVRWMPASLPSRLGLAPNGRDGLAVRLTLRL
jgi:hypothetical protein